MNLQAALDWLIAQPTGALLVAMFLLAVAENVFPPIPADTLVAFGAFLAARKGESAWPPFLVVWLGSVGGAIGMYAVGRHFGAAYVRRRMHMRTLKGKEGAEQRLKRAYARWGWPALVLSRFVPGVRAVMPPLAGALHVPFWGAAMAIGIASAVWYGIVAYLATRVGRSWESILETLGAVGAGTAIGAGVLLAVLAGMWLVWRRRRKDREGEAPAS